MMRCTRTTVQKAKDTHQSAFSHDYSAVSISSKQYDVSWYAGESAYCSVLISSMKRAFINLTTAAIGVTLKIRGRQQ